MQQEAMILKFLEAYSPDVVLNAFELYSKAYQNDDPEYLENFYLEEGWEYYTGDKDPENQVHITVNGKKMVLSEKARNQKIAEAKSKRAVKKVGANSRKKTPLELQSSVFSCPKCNAGLYKQAVCPACKEGKKGYRIRLICEENPEHEFLL